MNLDLILLLAFAMLLGCIMYFNRKRVVLEKIAFPLIYIVMYKTKLGLELMDKLAKKFPKFTKIFGFLGVVFGFLTMAVIFVLLTVKVYDFLFNNTPTPIAPLLPGIQTVPGIPVLGFWHWIISIFVLAVVHEFSHGWLARLYDIKVKSSGFAVLGIILPVVPAAFVEPDEAQLNNASKRKQLEILAAGSFSNYVAALIFLLLFLFIAVPALSSTIYSEGVVIAKSLDGYPANLSGLSDGDRVLRVNEIEINNINDFYNVLKEVGPGDGVHIETNVSSYDLIAAKAPKSFMNKLTFWKKERGYLGVLPLSLKSDFKEGYKILGEILSWISLLLYWLFTINLAVGMFNMLPLGPIDGGKMFLVAANFLLKDEKKARKLWTFISLFCLALIVIGMAPFLFKFFKFVFGPLIGLFF